jgi:predicted alpha/beta-fold hydrolase
MSFFTYFPVILHSRRCDNVKVKRAQNFHSPVEIIDFDEVLQHFDEENNHHHSFFAGLSHHDF